MQSQEVKPFSRLRAYLFPVYRSEFSKFIPLSLLAFFVGFNYSLLKIMKDSLVIGGSEAGAEVIPFLKVWGIVPGAVVMTMIYSWLSSRYQRDTVFYIIVGGFIGFFFLFATVIYPLGDLLHFHRLAHSLQSILPKGFRGFVAMIEYCDYSLYYVLSELWSSVVLSTLFWGLANEVTTIGEAGRFYGLVNTSLNLSSVAAGLLSLWVGQKALVPACLYKDQWHGLMLNLTSLIVISGLCMIWLYRSLSEQHHRSVDSSGGAKQESVAAAKAKKKKPKANAKNLFLCLIRSRYLLSIAIIVLSYNLVMHLFEVVWKDQVRQICSSRVAFNDYMSNITTLTGVISGVIALLALGQSVRKWGWMMGALATPLIILVSGGLFFGVIFLFRGNPVWLASGILGVSPLALTAWLGGMQNVLARSAKFTFFDQTKEMAFIPLPNEEKNHGKAVIDGVISRVGKSGGSLMYQGLLIIFSSIASSINVIAIVLLVIMVIWLIAVVSVGKEYRARVASEGTSELTPKEEATA